LVEAATMAKIETCTNCDTKIGRLEQAYLWHDQVVCERCHKKLSLKTSQTGASAVPQAGSAAKPKSFFRTGFGITCGVIVALAVGFFVLVVVGIVIANPDFREGFRQGSGGRTSAQILAEAAAKPKGDLAVDRVWVENLGGYVCAYATVTYANTTTETFTKAVTIQARALDGSGKALNVNDRAFFAHELGPIVPGFTGTLKIPVELAGRAATEFKSMECSIVTAR
jgi:hypothetical protein